MTSTGWECPVCGRVWAPFVAECPGPHTTHATGTTPLHHGTACSCAPCRARFGGA